MSNRLFQNVINQLKDVVSQRIIGVIDSKGLILACSNLSYTGNYKDDMSLLFYDPKQLIRHDGYTYKLFSSKNVMDYAVFVEGTDEIAESFSNILAISFSNIKLYYDEKYDKESFVKNILLDNVLPGDILLRAKELHFSDDSPRIVFLIRLSEPSEFLALDVVAGLFPDRNRDFVINMDETNVVLVREVRHANEDKEVYKIAKSISEAINAESMVKVIIGIGTMVKSIKDVSKSYREAQVALEVGKVFDAEKNIISYDNLGIGRLIYQLPTTLCELFLTEIFKKQSIDVLDQETIFTIKKFFENNLNVSETSRQLFVHRNTLVYRLDKIKNLTGLDLRIFDHAIVFKVAMMVKKYLTSSPIKM